LIAKDIKNTSCLSKTHHDSQTQDFLSRKVCVLALWWLPW